MRATRTPEQQLSKRVFNSEHRLSIVRTLVSLGGLATVSEVATRSGASPATVHAELHLLADLGVLQRIPVQTRVHFQPMPGPFWAWCDQLLEQVPAGT